MIHARPDYNGRIVDLATIAHKHGVPQGKWHAGPGYLSAPDGTCVALVQEPEDASACPLTYRLAALLAEVLNTSGAGIPEDEPVFLLRGQDRVGGDSVREWACFAEEVGAAQDSIDLAMHHADRMDTWAAERGGKVPDLPPVCLPPACPPPVGKEE